MFYVSPRRDEGIPPYRIIYYLPHIFNSQQTQYFSSGALRRDPPPLFTILYYLFFFSRSVLNF